MKAVEQLNCIDVVRPYVEAVTAEGMPPVQFLGGVGSLALLHPSTQIVSSERAIYAPGAGLMPAGLYLPNYKDPGKSTQRLRDNETMVLSSSKEQAKKVDDCATDKLEGNLIAETFEFRDLAWVSKLSRHPVLGYHALKSFVSDRFMVADSDWSADGPEAHRVLMPFSANIPNEALQTWSLRIGEDLVMPSPAVGAIIINYLTRSISGERPKDHLKIEEMSTAIFEKAPETVDWIVQGPGQSQFELARVLHTLREPKKDPATLTIGGKLDLVPLKFNELAEHPTFMFPDAPEDIQKLILDIAKFKSRALHLGESVPFLVSAWQKYVEPRISSVLHNK